MAKSKGSGGLSLSAVLGVVFIILKLTNLIDWKWIWVLSPFWIGVALFVVIIGGLLLVLKR